MVQVREPSKRDPVPGLEESTEMFPVVRTVPGADRPGLMCRADIIFLHIRVQGPVMASYTTTTTTAAAAVAAAPPPPPPAPPPPPPPTTTTTTTFFHSNRSRSLSLASGTWQCLAPVLQEHRTTWASSATNSSKPASYSSIKRCCMFNGGLSRSSRKKRIKKDASDADDTRGHWLRWSPCIHNPQS